MTLLRTQLGTTLRGHRLRQRRTLRDVSGAARVSLGYLSEVERGQKEASSELLASICDALDVELADLLAEVSLGLRGSDGRVRPLVPAAEVLDVPAEEEVGAAASGVTPRADSPGSARWASAVPRTVSARRPPRVPPLPHRQDRRRR